ncbi:hypothetical protein EJ06DRAFT_533657 [Trichodelitschia bisporula]|uniref:Uncharacterized protein n=1 Tax=Trichodelitschia bisporula TaxID=703511 RepID=A0A6G1HLK6_9PEZI|nr:hypothetical protein EJ06DRAFT_533657 [Trichodelitschia bisporula]
MSTPDVTSSRNTALQRTLGTSTATDSIPRHNTSPTTPSDLTLSLTPIPIPHPISHPPSSHYPFVDPPSACPPRAPALTSPPVNTRPPRPVPMPIGSPRAGATVVGTGGGGGGVMTVGGDASLSKALLPSTPQGGYPTSRP